MNVVRIGRTLIVPFLILACFACGHSKEGGAKKMKAKQESTNPAFAEIADDPKLPRVLLIGDSISIGYTLAVRELLEGVANLHRVPTNAGPTTRGIEKIDEWLGEGKWDVIHFNWGLHDIKFMDDGQRQVSLEAYRANLDSLVQRMRSTGAKLIWANTTPVPDGGVKPKRLPNDVIRYNAAAQDVMKQYQIPMDDLYSFALPVLSRIQQPVNVHFTELGSDALARCVASNIQLALMQEELKRRPIVRPPRGRRAR